MAAVTSRKFLACITENAEACKKYSIIILALIFAFSRSGSYLYTNFIEYNDLYTNIRIYFVMMIFLSYMIYSFEKNHNIETLKYLTVMLGLIAIIEIVSEPLKEDLLPYMKNMYDNYTDFESEIKSLQDRLECCGLRTYKEFIENAIEIPPRCCRLANLEKHQVCPEQFIHKIGCYDTFSQMRHKITILYNALISLIFAFALSIILEVYAIIKLKFCNSTHQDARSFSELPGKDKLIKHDDV